MNTVIKTPDQRLRVFVSSTLQELAEERVSVKDAIISLNLIPVMFELGARPYAPRDLYTAYLQQSHIFVGIYWQSYGWVAPDMSISGLEDEFILSEKMPRLIYIKEPATERSDALNDMITQIQNSGVSYKTFSGIEELRTLVMNDLSLLIMERFELTMARKNQDIESDSLNQLFPIPPTTLIGRQKVVKDLLYLLHNKGIRLITLSGTGGIGKSRVGLEVINRIKNEGVYSVCFIPLASLDQAEKLMDFILKNAYPSANLAIEARVLLVDLIRDKNIFMVLDNFEHLIESRLDVTYLLERCPNLKILITSRELLHISGEFEYSLPPLEICSNEEHTMPLEADLSAAVTLFIDRAKNIHPDFKLDQESYKSIREICTLLDGIPLAIELAAARMRLFSPGQLAKRLKKDLNILKGSIHDLPERHQTLNATVEWSYNLLSTKEQNLLCMLSVLSGGGTLEAAAYIGVEQKCNQELWEFPRKSFYISLNVFETIKPETSEVEFLEAAESLLSKSLAFTSVNKFGSLRINFYQTIIHYCADKLEEKNLTYLAKFRHLVYYLYLAEGNWYQLKSENAEEVYESLDNDISNIESALAWSFENEPMLGLRLSIAMAEYWDTRGNFKETLQWIEKMMAQLPDLQKHHFHIYCIARFELSRAYFRADEFQKAIQMIEDSLSEAREHNADLLITDAFIFKSLISVYALRSENKDEIISESIRLAKSNGYEMAILEALQHQAADRIFNGRVDEGIPIAEETLVWARKLTAIRWEAISLFFLGFGWLMKGNLEESEEWFKQALSKTLKVKDQILPVYSLLGIAQISFSRQNLEKTSLLVGAIYTYIKKPGVSIVPMVMQIYGTLMQQLQNIPEEQWHPIVENGKGLRLNEAIDIVFENDVKPNGRSLDMQDGLELNSLNVSNKL